MLEEMTHCIPPNPRMVGNIVAIHGPLDGPNTYTPTHLNNQHLLTQTTCAFTILQFVVEHMPVSTACVIHV